MAEKIFHGCLRCPAAQTGAACEACRRVQQARLDLIAVEERLQEALAQRRAAARGTTVEV